MTAITSTPNYVTIQWVIFVGGNVCEKLERALRIMFCGLTPTCEFSIVDDEIQIIFAQRFDVSMSTHAQEATMFINILYKASARGELP